MRPICYTECCKSTSLVRQEAGGQNLEACSLTHQDPASEEKKVESAKGFKPRFE